MRTTLTLDEDLYRAARVLAETSGKSLSRVVCELVRKGLQSRPPHDYEGDFPVFSVPSNAKTIPADRASELLENEDIDAA